MPIIKSAKKKMRKDKIRTLHNQKLETNIKNRIKKTRKEPSVQNFQQVMSSLDKAAKTHLIHKNKAARLKSRLNKRITTTV